MSMLTGEEINTEVIEILKALDSGVNGSDLGLAEYQIKITGYYYHCWNNDEYLSNRYFCKKEDAWVCYRAAENGMRLFIQYKVENGLVYKPVIVWANSENAERPSWMEFHLLEDE